MEADTDPAAKNTSMRLSLTLRSGSELAGLDGAQEAAASAVADWHREAQERKQRQFSMYMNRKRYVVPAAGLKPIPAAPAINEKALISLPAAASSDGRSDGGIATASPLPSAGSLELHKQQQLAPELRALMALSTEAHDGWMAKLEKAGRSHKTLPRSHVALHSPRRTRRARLKGTKKAHGDKGHLSIALTGEDLTQLSSQCMQDTELVYTKGKAQDHKAMLLVAMPACSAATAEMPASVEVSGGRRMLMVLPSNLTCQREDALEAERMLADIPRCPADAADRTAAWRQRMLEKACRPALGDLGHEPPATCRDPYAHDEDTPPRREAQSRAGLPTHRDTRGQHRGDERLKSVAWDTHCIGSMLAGTSMVMAELVRQAESACAESGHVLAATWNLHLGLADAMTEVLRQGNAQQADDILRLRADAMQLQAMAAENSRLQGEITCLQKDIQGHELAASQAKLREKEAEEALDVGLQELKQIDKIARRQLAVMRWQHARAVLACEHKQSLIKLPAAKSHSTLQQVELLQATATARACSLFRRDRAHADQQRSQAGSASGGANPGSRFAHIVEDTMVGSAALLQSLAGDAEKAASMLHTLAPEARAMVLSSLAPAERTELLRGMSDEEAAICLAAMSLNTRTAVIADLAAADASLVACALACVWWLGSMGSQEAARELLENTDLKQQRQALIQMKPHRAAALLEDMQQHDREGILAGMLPDATAKMLAIMPRAMAIDALQTLIPPIAQQVLACFGASDKSALLDHMSVGETMHLIHSWIPVKQKELLQAMPGSTAAEVTLQLLLQSSHKWVYKAPVRAQPRTTNTALLLEHEAAAGLEGIAEDDVSGAADVAEPPDSIPDEIPDEEYDEEEVAEQTAAARHEAELAAASVAGLAFEDKLKLLTALQPEPLAALVGVLPRQEAASLLAHVPPLLLEQALDCMDVALKEALSEAVNNVPLPGSLRRSSLRSMLRSSIPQQRPQTAASQASKDSYSRRGSMASSVGSKAPRRTTLRLPRDSGVRNVGRASMASLTSAPSTASADKEQGAKAGARKTARSTVGPRQSASTALPQADARAVSRASEARTSTGKPVRSFVGSRQSMAAPRPDPEASAVDKNADSKPGTRRPANSSVGPRQSTAASTTPGNAPGDTEDGIKLAALLAIGSRQSVRLADAGVGISIADEEPQLADSV